MNLAITHDVRTIAFPAISCGIYGYPIGSAAQIAIDTTTAFLRQDESLTEVIFACYNENVRQAFQAALER
jgi:O-acetyl-ADP-ribose deacetylase (regulator of RNase III)